MENGNNLSTVIVEGLPYGIVITPSLVYLHLLDSLSILPIINGYSSVIETGSLPHDEKNNHSEK